MKIVDAWCFFLFLQILSFSSPKKTRWIFGEKNCWDCNSKSDYKMEIRFSSHLEKYCSEFHWVIIENFIHRKKNGFYYFFSRILKEVYYFMLFSFNFFKPKPFTILVHFYLIKIKLGKCVACNQFLWRFLIANNLNAFIQFLETTFMNFSDF